MTFKSTKKNGHLKTSTSHKNPIPKEELSSQKHGEFSLTQKCKILLKFKNLTLNSSV